MSTGDAVAASVPRSLGAVLLGASRATAEPDGIHWAAALSGGVEGSSGAQLALLQHEGDWAGAVALCDAGAMAGAQSASMLPAALLQLGCTSAAAAVAKALLSGRSKGGNASAFNASELRDAASEAAWRMGQWSSWAPSSAASSSASSTAAAAAGGDEIDGVPTSSSSPLFNVSVCAALAAIQGRDPEAAASALSAARSSVVFDELATAWGSGGGGEDADAAEERSALAAPSAAATAAISRLQMLATLEEALSSSPSSFLTAAGSEDDAPVHFSSFAASRARAREAATGRALGAGSGLGFAALEPLIAVRRAAAAALGDAAAERTALVDAARAARVAGRVPAARAALAALRAPIDALSSSSSSLLFGSASERERRRCNTGGAAGPGSGELPGWVRSEISPVAPWRMEELELLWEGGQHASALRVARGLLADAAAAEREGGSADGDVENEEPANAAAAPPRRSSFAPTPISPVWRAGLMSLVGKWLAESGLEGPAAALDTLRAATAEADAAARDENEGGRSGGGNNANAALLSSQLLDISANSNAAARTACTASFRLASYADKLHAGAVARRSSPEAAKADALVAARRASKLRPLELERSANAAKLRRAEALLARNPRDAAARDSKARAEQTEKYLAWHVAAERKHVAADLAFPRELARNEAAYLSTAIQGHGRALVAADSHDLHAVHRFVALFLAHGRKSSGRGGAEVEVEQEEQEERQRGWRTTAAATIAAATTASVSSRARP